MSGISGLWLGSPDTPAAWLADGARSLARFSPDRDLSCFPSPRLVDGNDPVVLDENDAWSDAGSGISLAAQGPEASVVAGPQGRVVVAAVGMRPEAADGPDGPAANGTGLADGADRGKRLTVREFAAHAERVGPREALLAWPEAAAGAVWDRRTSRLWIFRDAMGRWPAYYGWMPGMFVFAFDARVFDRFARAFGPDSPHRDFREWQSSSFRRLGQWKTEVDPRALRHLVRYGHVGWPLTIHWGIYALPPGSYLELAPADTAAEPSRFSPWPTGNAAPGLHPREWSEFVKVPETVHNLEDAAATVGGELDAWIERHAAQDGDAVGLALSGGLDSALLAVRLAKRRKNSVRAFTMGFRGGAFDESGPAADIARALGLGHTACAMPSAESLPDLARRLNHVYDQPYGNPSALPTMALLRAFAEAGVRTVYMGDGADEAFAGYRRHWVLPYWWKRLSRCPWVLRRAAGLAAGLVPGRAVSWMLARRWPVEMARQGADGLWRRCVCALAAWDALDFHHRFHATGFSPNRVLSPLPRSLAGGDPLPLLNDLPGGSRAKPPSDRFGPWFRIFLEYDRAHGLIDDGIVKIDAPARIAGLTLRLPFMAPGMMRHARACAPGVLRGLGRDPSTGKQPLRALLEREIPGQDWDRPKRGFAAPVGEWLRGPLRDWAEALLEAKRLEESGWWKPAPLRRVWRRHLAGGVEAGLSLWPVLAMEQWRRPV